MATPRWPPANRPARIGHKPKTEASAATIDVEPHVIARMELLIMLTVTVRSTQGYAALKLRESRGQ